MYKHILVTTDGSDIDHAAIRHAAELTRALSARLTLLHIVPDAHVELSSGNECPGRHIAVGSSCQGKPS